jgi:hypothetical protein
LKQAFDTEKTVARFRDLPKAELMDCYSSIARWQHTNQPFDRPPDFGQMAIILVRNDPLVMRQFGNGAAGSPQSILCVSNEGR